MFITVRARLHQIVWYGVVNSLCSTAIAIRGKDGVVLGVEKLISSKLHELTSNRRIFTIDKHIGVVSGDKIHAFLCSIKSHNYCFFRRWLD